MSLSRLLNNNPSGSSSVAMNGVSAHAPAAVASGSASTESTTRKRSRASRASVSFHDDLDGDEEGSSARRSSRRSIQPKRYIDDIYADIEDVADTSFDLNSSRNGAEAVAPPEADEDSDSDSETLLRATAHIWREPLQAYLDRIHAERQQLEQDWIANEASRHFATAARIASFTERRIDEMRARKEAKLLEREQELQAAARLAEQERQRIEFEAERNAIKEREKEDRLRKQREAAKRKRDEDREKKGKAEEARKIRSEKDREARRLEFERWEALTPEQRAEEEKLYGERFKFDRDEMLNRFDLDQYGKGARKKKRLENDDPSGLGYEDGDLEEDVDELAEGAHGSSRGANGASSHDMLRQSSSHLMHSPTSSRAGSNAPGYASDDVDHESARDLNSSPVKAKKTRSAEELERKLWIHIAKRDIPKVSKIQQQSSQSRQFFAKRVGSIVAREARRAATRTKTVKDVQVRAKRVVREMMLFMKGNEKRERESRKKAEKEALDKAKKEEEMREAKRQARKLNFLITQTELYSHFIGNKIKTSEAEESEDTASDAKIAAPAESNPSVIAALAKPAASNGALKDLNFDVDDEANVAEHARRGAQAAVDAAKNAASAFDAAAGQAKPANGAEGLSFDDSDDLNFQNPTMTGAAIVTQPRILTCTLKEYQLKGLNWLANLYEQGINGILADEMGLGKTVQSISLMAYLAEVHDIWGPFLVIAPASTLHNWQQEITRFVPALKALPYWGNTKDRAILRKFWNRKSLRYDKDAPFHILVTSYQLVVQDEKYFQGVKWQYMVLDEAQAIKSSSSTRWKTLLSFKCRNRLLLTGTPIQNSMHELWALLHFIMPSLFDSHDEFSEWFSKDIEGNAENKGAMNEHQLRRLHMILKPFMLRRIKKNVQNELGDKIEIDVYCDLTPRQKAMYRTLREHISITDLVSRATSLNDDDSVKRLMNLIMQFRKVCNHPELFERADVTAPFAFANFPVTSNLVRDPEMLEVAYATRSVIEYAIPKLLYRDGGLLNVPGQNSRAGSDSLHLDRLLNIWSPDYIQHSLRQGESTFAFAQSLGFSPSELSKVALAHDVIRIGLALENEATKSVRGDYDAISLEGEAPAPFSLVIPNKTASLLSNISWREGGLVPLAEVEQEHRVHSRLAKPDARFYMDKVVAPSIDAVCSDRSFAYDQERQRFDPLFSAAIYGLPGSSQNTRTDIQRFESALPGLPAQGVLGASSPAQLPFPPMQVPQLHKLILDSGKLAKLDSLLAELKTGDHRVLLYFQMTRMIDLMEEYLAFRQYKYLRLDGSSTISERRDMVMDWQTKPELFIFLLSTRAGGLGINLTAADTVIFYDSDWNPSNDAQAMDRAHRLGQTKQVTVYRLITKDTVDERIVQLARNKKLVQDAVVQSSSGLGPTDSGAKTNEVVSLLLDDQELEESIRNAEIKRKKAEEKAKEDGHRGVRMREEAKRQKKAAALAAANKPSRWEAEDDEEDAFGFFAANKAVVADDEDGMTSMVATLGESGADSVNSTKTKGKGGRKSTGEAGASKAKRRASKV
ncbi:BQ5605_C008g05214 [Microbotryum silenes-dioicae]|uniref:Chromatin-remodeling ATPase INO80 n=1 Tax=Microbotryum silenes-dioicae TaxID=796604 RepID=A0A2X0P806_9BASI|nr:BQ5605_C008g05214 [Microbotryum silenes-dioicae]